MIKTEIIEKYMKDNNLSKKKLCQLCKISPSTLSKIMKNDRNFGIIALFKIARVMNIHIHELFENKKRI